MMTNFFLFCFSHLTKTKKKLSSTFSKGRRSVLFSFCEWKSWNNLVYQKNCHHHHYHLTVARSWSSSLTIIWWLTAAAAATITTTTTTGWWQLPTYNTGDQLEKKKIFSCSYNRCYMRKFQNFLFLFFFGSKQQKKNETEWAVRIFSTCS